MPKQDFAFLELQFVRAEFGRCFQASSASERRGMCSRPTYGLGSSSSPFGTLRPHVLRDVAERLHLPALGDVAEGGGDARELFVAGEAEVDEPLAVEGAGHRLQEPDAPLTVLHQLVVGRQDARYPPLHRQRGKRNFNLPQICLLMSFGCAAPVDERLDVRSVVQTGE